MSIDLRVKHEPFCKRNVCEGSSLFLITPAACVHIIALHWMITPRGNIFLHQLVFIIYDHIRILNQSEFNESSIHS